ncbi:MAG: cupin domain-containing protein [Polyangiaceae bacterium]|nr:cupin domain-containing protein [Polyangiaceae bacterium]
MERFTPFATRLAELTGMPGNDARRALHVYTQAHQMPEASRPGMRAVTLTCGPNHADVTATLAYFDPGTVLEAHTHSQEEHVLVFQGAYRSSQGHVVSAGQEEVCPPGSTHAVEILPYEPCLCAIIKTPRNASLAEVA